MTELTIFLGFHTLRMVFLFLSHIVVTLFALGTSQCNLYAHNFHLQCFHLHGLLLRLISGIKKDPTSMSLVQFITGSSQKSSLFK